MRFIAAAPRTDLFTGKYFLYISGFLNGSFILYIEDRNESRKPLFSFSRCVCGKRLHSTLEIFSSQFSSWCRRIYATKGRVRSKIESNLCDKGKGLSNFSLAASSYNCKNRDFQCSCIFEILPYIKNYMSLQ